MRGAKGYTLIELLVVTVLASLLATMALPGLREMVVRQQARADSALLYDMLMMMRLHALFHAVPVTLCPSADQQQCDAAWTQSGLLLFADADEDGRVGAGDVRLAWHPPAHEGARWLWRSFRNKPYVQMDRRGATNNLNGTLTYCAPAGRLDLARRLVLNKAGRVRVLTATEFMAAERDEVRALCRVGYSGR